MLCPVCVPNPTSPFPVLLSVLRFGFPVRFSFFVFFLPALMHLLPVLEYVPEPVPPATVPVEKYPA